VNSFLKRAYAVVSSYGSMHGDSQRIKTMLMCNGFPANFLDDCVRNFLHRLYALVSYLLGLKFFFLSRPTPVPLPRGDLVGLAPQIET